jgi:hypothetical protein
MSKSIDPIYCANPEGEPFRLCPRSHRLDEFAASYSSAGCSPAEPASASLAGLYFQANETNLSTAPLDLKDRSRQNINHRGGPNWMIEVGQAG